MKSTRPQSVLDAPPSRQKRSHIATGLQSLRSSLCWKSAGTFFIWNLRTVLLERENVVRKVVWYPRACAVFGASGASTRAHFKPYYNTGDNMTPHKAPLLACVRYLAYCSMGRGGEVSYSSRGTQRPTEATSCLLATSASAPRSRTKTRSTLVAHLALV